MKSTINLLISALLASAIIFTFNFFFMGLMERPAQDQILLTALPTASLCYLLFSLFEHIAKPDNSWKPQITRPKNYNLLIKFFLLENFPGIALALAFLAIYTLIGLEINTPNIDRTDNFFDADNYAWNHRISAPDGTAIEMRGPHPFAYFILRPFGWVMNFFIQNYWLSSILVNTLAGALSVFMTWLFIKRQFQDSIYAFLIASLLGLSTAHLFFGSVVETYIFSATALIGFVLALQSQKSSSMGLAVGTSLLTFGITLTNFIQNFIGYAVASFSQSEPRSRKTFNVYFKEIIHFTSLTISLGILISLLHAARYPSSQLFFLPSSVQAEGEFAFNIFQEPVWKVIGRISLLIRTALMYTIIAPKPYSIVEVSGGFPRLNFFKIVPGTFSLSSYDGLAQFLVVAWAIFLFAAGILFLMKIIRTRKVDISLAFALSVGFNLTLHLIYGFEPFLYSPDWAYALIFFVAYSLAPLAKNRFFQGGLLMFLILLAYNQFQFLQFIFKTIAAYTL